MGPEGEKRKDDVHPDKQNADDIVSSHIVNLEVSYKDPNDGVDVNAAGCQEISMRRDGKVVVRNASSQELGEAGFYSKAELNEHLEAGGNINQIFSETGTPDLNYTFGKLVKVTGKPQSGTNSSKSTSVGYNKKYSDAYDKLFGKKKDKDKDVDPDKN